MFLYCPINSLFNKYCTIIYKVIYITIIKKKMKISFNILFQCSLKRPGKLQIIYYCSKIQNIINTIFQSKKITGIKNWDLKI